MVSEGEGFKIIKSCSLDPAPACVISNCIDVLLPAIADMTNHSLQYIVFPSILKSTLITPILKKHTLQAIYNLPFIGKVMECVVSNWFPTSINTLCLPHPSLPTDGITVLKQLWFEFITISYSVWIQKTKQFLFFCTSPQPSTPLTTQSYLHVWTKDSEWKTKLYTGVLRICRDDNKQWL